MVNGFVISLLLLLWLCVFAMTLCCDNFDECVQEMEFVRRKTFCTIDRIRPLGKNHLPLWCLLATFPWNASTLLQLYTTIFFLLFDESNSDYFSMHSGRLFCNFTFMVFLFDFILVFIQFNLFQENISNGHKVLNYIYCSLNMLEIQLQAAHL